jgi:hypothetical protein
MLVEYVCDHYNGGSYNVFTKFARAVREPWICLFLHLFSIALTLSYSGSPILDETSLNNLNSF